MKNLLNKELIVKNEELKSENKRAKLKNEELKSGNKILHMRVDKIEEMIAGLDKLIQSDIFSK